MRTFLLIYLVGYGGMNAYALWRIGRGLGRIGLWWLGLVMIGGLALGGPIAAHLAHGRGAYGVARMLALVSFSWMAVVMWCICLGVLADAWNGAVRCLTAAGAPAAGWAITPGAWLLGVAVLVTGLFAWGCIEGRRLVVEEVQILSRKLPPGTGELRLVQISDLHVGLTQGAATVRQIVDRVAALDPDVVVVTGDVFDGLGPETEALARALAAIEAPLGTYAVTGNHEFYAGIERVEELFALAGLSLLRGEHVDITPHVRLAGVDDPAGLREGLGGARLDENQALGPPAAGVFRILLKHRPTLSVAAGGHCDLQLSGHTHGGQVFPFGIFERLLYPLGHGLKQTPQGGQVYISRGAGNWGPPIRVFAPREITLVRILATDDPEGEPAGTERHARP